MMSIFGQNTWCPNSTQQCRLTAEEGSCAEVSATCHKTHSWSGAAMWALLVDVISSVRRVLSRKKLGSSWNVSIRDSSTLPYKPCSSALWQMKDRLLTPWLMRLVLLATLTMGGGGEVDRYLKVVMLSNLPSSTSHPLLSLAFRATPYTSMQRQLVAMEIGLHIKPSCGPIYDGIFTPLFLGTVNKSHQCRVCKLSRDVILYRCHDCLWNLLREAICQEWLCSEQMRSCKDFIYS